MIERLGRLFTFQGKPLCRWNGNPAFGIGRKSMKKSEMKVYKELLLALRARLRGDVHAMADAA